KDVPLSGHQTGLVHGGTDVSWGALDERLAAVSGQLCDIRGSDGGRRHREDGTEFSECMLPRLGGVPKYGDGRLFGRTDYGGAASAEVDASDGADVLRRGVQSGGV